MEAAFVQEDYQMSSIRILVLAHFLFYLLVGCNPPGPSPPPKPSVIKVESPPYNDDQDILALSLANNTDVSPSPTPVPDDRPKVGDTCPECDGKGQVGDGTVFRPCLSCGADGRVDDGDPILVSSSQENSEGDSESSIVDIINPLGGALETLRDMFLNAHSEQEEAIQEISDRLKQLEDGIESTGNSLSTDDEQIRKQLEEQAARVNQIDARVKALESKPAPAVVPQQPKQPYMGEPDYSYRVYWEGIPYVWRDGERAFVSRYGRRITIPNLGPISRTPDVKVCENTPQGMKCTYLTVHRFDPKNDPTPPIPRPSLSVMLPSSSPAPSGAAVVRPSSQSSSWSPVIPGVSVAAPLSDELRNDPTINP